MCLHILKQNLDFKRHISWVFGCPLDERLVVVLMILVQLPTISVGIFKSLTIRKDHDILSWKFSSLLRIYKNVTRLNRLDY